MAQRRAYRSAQPFGVFPAPSIFVCIDDPFARLLSHLWRLTSTELRERRLLGVLHLLASRGSLGEERDRQRLRPTGGVDMMVLRPSRCRATSATTWFPSLPSDTGP